MANRQDGLTWSRVSHGGSAHIAPRAVRLDKPVAALRAKCVTNLAMNLMAMNRPNSMAMRQTGPVIQQGRQVRDKLAGIHAFIKSQPTSGVEVRRQSINQRAGPRLPATTSRPCAVTRQVRRSTFLAAKQRFNRPLKRVLQASWLVLLIGQILIIQTILSSIFARYPIATTVQP